ncbi:TOMM precursor leader peptide-binding protein [Streptomyces sp. NBC_00455]|uniref:TOMM precursor leader peptide-binding protein n=1 Tax=Streptomyces sp. NBC_00455 TaxID=2903654 RepID=UPI002E1ACA63
MTGTLTNTGPEQAARTGLLARSLAGALARLGVEVRASDTWRLPADGPADRPWLSVHTEVGQVVVGPLTRPGLPGCPHCLALRRQRVDASKEWLAPLREEHAARLERDVPQLLDELAAGVVADVAAGLVADETAEAEDRRPLSDDAPGQQGRRLMAVVDLATLETRRHHFLPDPFCPHCGTLPDDTAEQAQRILGPAPKIAPFGARTRDVLAEFEAVRELYVDPYSGLIRRTDRGAEGGLVMSGASMPLRFDNLAEPGYGRSRDYRTSELTAILEALERYGGVAPGGLRTTVRGTGRELAPHAVHPDVFGRHPDESYDDPGFRYRRFDPDQPLWWVWAHSFAAGEARLVPEALAYYYCHRLRGDDPVSYYEVSNGCALGSSWEEATLHGLMETVERDAFLCTWYTRTVPPTIDLDSCRDPRVPLQTGAITASTGYRVHAFDITTDYGIPAVWVMAAHPDRQGPALLCTAGAGLEPERALLNALNELGPILSDVIRRYPDEAERAAEMVRDPRRVVTMPDHSALYAHPEAAHRLDFLFGGPVIGVDEIGGPDRLRPDRDDVTVDLRAAVGRVGEVLVVDQTTPEHRAGGFSCVKVLVPGAVPMTFGYRNRRIDGLPRLLSLPRRLGRRDADLTREQLNPDPHPFP